jgi:hypothetical protein
MTTHHFRTFWVAMIALLLIHSIISFASYRFFTVSMMKPADDVPVDVSTPAQKAAGEDVIRITTKRTATPMPVIFYICGGYIALGAAVLYLAYLRLRAI